MLKPRNTCGAAATALVALVVLVGCGDDASTEVGAGEVPTENTSASVATDTASDEGEVGGVPQSADEIIDLVEGVADNLGEPEPTDVEWVASTRRAANLLISGSTVGADDADVDVLVIQAQGDFTVPGTSGPPDEETGQTAPAPTGTVLTLVLDAESGRTLDQGVHHAPADLTELGVVEQAPTG